MGGSKGNKREKSLTSSTSNIKSTKKGKKSTDVISKEKSTNSKPKDASKAAKFESEKAEILESIPQSYRDMFGQIGFCPWVKALLPVLILNPFDVPPKPVREKWLTMYHKKKSRGELDSMTYLIYWYGSERESDFYYFTSLKQIVLYEAEKAKKKSVYKLSEQIQAKIDSNTDLTAKEIESVQRYEEMEKDLLVEPSERKRGVIDFEELHEFDEDEGDSENVEDHEDDLADNSADRLEDGLTVVSQAKPDKRKSKSTAPATTKAKFGRPKKIVLPIVEESVEAVGTTVLHAIDGLSVAGKEPSIKKKAKQNTDVQIQTSKKKEKRRLDDDIAEEELPVAYDKTDHGALSENNMKLIEAWAASVESSNVKDVEILLRKVVVEVTAAPKKFVHQSDIKSLLYKTEELFNAAKADLTSIIALNDALQDTNISKAKRQPSNQDPTGTFESKGGITKKRKVDSAQSDDDKSLCYALEDDLSSHDEEDDEFPYERPENKDKQVVAGASKKLKKAKPAKKIQSTKIKMDKPPSTKQLKRKEEEAKKKEEAAFRQCEESHWDLLRRWKGAIDDKSNVLLQALVLEAITVVESFCVTFIRGYQIGDIIKETRRVLKDAQDDLASYKILKEKIKTTYTRNEIYVPVGFAPTRSRPDVFANTVSQKSNDEHVGCSIDFSQRSVESMDDIQKRSESKSLRNGKASEGDSTERSKASETLDQNVIPTKSLVRSGSDIGAGAARSGTQPKVERKKFTLSTFMRPASKDETTSETVVVAESTEEVVARRQPIIPQWVKGPATTDAPADYPRSLALEFLVQMAEHLPEGSVDIDSVTRSIETAVFTWATKGSTGSGWANTYWAKIHLIVAAICGKTEKGTIQDLLLQGHFDVPEKLVALAEEKLTASFEGHPLVL